MPTPDATPVVIACPNCGTRYQLAYSAIGRRGRSVQCASCGKSWQAHAERPHAPPPAPKPPPSQETEALVLDLPGAPRHVAMDTPFGKLAEEMLDLKFTEEEARHRARREASKIKPPALPKPEVIADLPPGAPKAAGAAGIAEDLLRAAFLGRSKVKREGDPVDDDEAAHGAAPSPEITRDPGYQRTVDEIKVAIAPKPRPAAPPPHADPAAARRLLLQAFFARQRSIASRLPLARFRRAARVGSLVALVTLLAGGYQGRYPLVQAFPQLAWLYALIGLDVNVVGLEFHGVRTLQSLQQGIAVLEVDGTIASVSSHPVAVPQVVVSLLDKNGTSLYEWSMVPKAAVLAPGESVALETHLSGPPAGATQVKLVFASGRQIDLPNDDGTPSGTAAPVVLGAPAGTGLHGPR
jgi:predicted Zn finger-like uncharacterized protein